MKNLPRFAQLALALTSVFLHAIPQATASCAQWTIHAFPSDRLFRSGKTESYEYQLQHQPIAGITGPIAPFTDTSELVSGLKTVVDLGSGRSDFIPTLIEECMAAGGDCSGLHAVDFSYITIHARPSAARFAGHVDSFVARYPANFHGQLFQELDVQVRGQKILFDEAVSSSSLMYVLMKAPTEECELILSRILGHLSRKGHLRIWKDGHGDWEPAFHKIRPFLERQLSAGEVSNYSLPLPDRDSFVIVK
jgi:hypothetical protein